MPRPVRLFYVFRRGRAGRATERVPGPPPLAVRIAPRVRSGPGRGRSTCPDLLHADDAATVTVDMLNSSGSRVRRVLASRAGRRSIARLLERSVERRTGPNGRRWSGFQPAPRPGGLRPARSGGRLDDRLVSPGAESLLAEPGRPPTWSRCPSSSRGRPVRLRVVRGTTRLATLVSSSLPAGAHSYIWNGRDRERPPRCRTAPTDRLEATTGARNARAQAFGEGGRRPPHRSDRQCGGRPPDASSSASASPVKLVIRYGSSDPVSEELPAGERRHSFGRGCAG